MAQFIEFLPIVLTLVSFGSGLLLGWHFTGRYYRKLVTELIGRHCELTRQMRVELEQHQASSSASSQVA